MPKRYFCDYCYRSFADNLDARKKHLLSAVHVRNRKLHYKQFRGLKEVVKEERTKTECRRFLQTGICQFGENCNYTHYSKSELQEIEIQATEKEKERSKLLLDKLPTVNSWLKNHTKALCLNETLPVQQTYSFGRADLPASLQPIQIDDLIDIDLNKWG